MTHKMQPVGVGNPHERAMELCTQYHDGELDEAGLIAALVALPIVQRPQISTDGLVAIPQIGPLSAIRTACLLELIDATTFIRAHEALMDAGHEM